jgi:hypothetical protein
MIVTRDLDEAVARARAAELGRRFVAIAGSRARYTEAWGTILAGVEPAEVVAELH